MSSKTGYWGGGGRWLQKSRTGVARKKARKWILYLISTTGNDGLFSFLFQHQWGCYWENGSYFSLYWHWTLNIVPLENGYFQERKKCKRHLTHVTRKQTLRTWSLSYKKKDGRVWPILLLVWHGLFRIWVIWLYRSYSLKVSVIPFWYDNDQDLKVCFLVTRVI